MSTTEKPTIEKLERTIQELKKVHEEQAEELARRRLLSLGREGLSQWDGVLVFHSLDGLEHREPMRNVSFHVSHRRLISRPILSQPSCERVFKTEAFEKMHSFPWKREYELRMINELPCYVGKKYLLHYHERSQS